MSLSRPLRPFVLSFVLVSLFPLGARGAPFDEPLPDGARARLGSTQFRLPSLYRATLSPDGQVLAVLDRSDSVLLLDPLTGKARKRVAVQLRGRSLHFSADGKKLMGYEYGQMTVVDLVKGTQQQWAAAQRMPLEGQPRFSADGRYVAVGFRHLRREQEGKITVWDLTTGKKAHEITPLHTEYAEGALSPDGKRLASWGRVSDQKDRDKMRILQVWDLPDEKEVRQIDIGQYTPADAAFSPDGKHLAVIGSDRTIGIWEVATGKPVQRFAARRDTTSPLIFSPDGKTLAAGSQEGAVQLWDLGAGKRIGVVGGPKCRLLSVALRDGGRGLAVGMDHQTLYVWELPTGVVRTPLVGHKAAVHSLGFLDGGKILCSGGVDGLYWWDVASGKPTRHWTADPNGRYLGRGYFTQFAFSPDERYLAGVPEHDGHVSFLDPDTLREHFSLMGVRNYRRAFGGAFSGNQTFAHLRQVPRAGARGLELTVWDLTRGQPIRDIDVGYVDNPVLDLSPDGRLVALANNASRPDPRVKGVAPQTVSIWEVATGKHIASPGSGGGQVTAMAFALDGRSLVAVLHDGRLWVWEAGTGGRVAGLEKVSLSPTSPLVFSPDGRTFALAGTEPTGREGEVAVWELATGKLRVRYRGHQGAVSALAYSPDGRLLASGAADTTVLLWDRSRRPDDRPPAGEGEDLWAELNAPDPVRGHRAVLRLLATPEEAVKLVSERLKPEDVAELSEAEIAGLIADLDGDTFARRERAVQTLAKAGKQAEPALQAALASRPSPEKRRRLEELLKRLAGGRRAPERVGPTRALEVLERLGTPAAQRLLESLSKARPPTWLAEEAGESLRRLRRRR